MYNINFLNETEKTDKYIFKCNVCELEDTNFKNFSKYHISNIFHLPSKSSTKQVEFSQKSPEFI